MPPKPVKTTRMGVKRRKSTHESHPTKKRKLQSGPPSKSKGKQRAYERDSIPIPNEPQSDHESSISEEDMDFFRENIPGFLSNLDAKSISRSKKEIARLHQMSKPQSTRKVSFAAEDDSDLGSLSEYDSNNTISDTPSESEDDLEQAYESRSQLANSTEQPETVPRLPIKMSDGRIVQTGHRVMPDQTPSDGYMSKSSNTLKESFPKPQPAEDVTTQVTTVLNASSRQLRIEAAKDDIAQICQGILADPENSLGSLRRLHSFMLPHVPSINKTETMENDPLIRQLAMVSELAVFKDIIPGYRIRPLTDAEKNDKVSRAVLQLREWEQGFVSIYQNYLRLLEGELKNKTDLAELALKSMCMLLIEATHFNFRANIINAIISYLSKKKWNNRSEMCSQTLISVFMADKDGTPSLEIVRMLNRMIKERRFMVHPNVFSCLLHLRLKSSLTTAKASEQGVERDRMSSGKVDRKRAKGKKVDQPHVTKKAKKILKERKEIEAQLREADAEVDQEEKAKMQSETLQLLFGLYFRILKLPGWSPLLPPALEGISRHAHMVNVDFFKDLMNVLKDLVSRSSQTPSAENLSEGTILRYKLLCIVTAFELLTGQGDALNIDLKDFYIHLYNLIIPLSLVRETAHSLTNILFRGLSLAFPAHRGNARSPIRTAAFAKRMLSAFFLFPANVVTRLLKFVEELVLNEPKLLALLSTEDRSFNGIYRPDIDEPELCNPYSTSLWELSYLAAAHSHQEIRQKAQTILNLGV